MFSRRSIRYSLSLLVTSKRSCTFWLCQRSEQRLSNVDICDHVQVCTEAGLVPYAWAKKCKKIPSCPTWQRGKFPHKTLQTRFRVYRKTSKRCLKQPLVNFKQQSLPALRRVWPFGTPSCPTPLSTKLGKSIHHYLKHNLRIKCLHCSYLRLIDFCITRF